MKKFEVDYDYMVRGRDVATIDAVDDNDAVLKAEAEAEKIYGQLEDFYAFEVREINGN